MVTSQNTPDLMNLRDCQRGRILKLKNCPGHSWRNTGKQLLSYTFTNIQLEPFTTPRWNTAMWCCFAWASLVTAMAEWYFSIRGKFQSQCTALFPCGWAKWSTFQQINWKEIFCPSNPSSHWNSLHTKAPLLQAHLLGQGSLVQLCKKYNWYRHSTSPQNIERQVSEIRSRVISNSGKQCGALQSEKLSNYRLWALLMVLAINWK